MQSDNHRHDDPGAARRHLGATRRWLNRIDGGWMRCQPELELFPSEREARRALRRASFRLIGRIPFLASVAVAVTLSLSLTLALRLVFSRPGLPLNQTTINIMLAFPVMIACSFVAIWLMGKHIRLILRNDLLDLGVPICLGCGFELAGLPGPRCPECGREFDERIGARDDMIRRGRTQSDVSKPGT